MSIADFLQTLPNQKFDPELDLSISETIKFPYQKIVVLFDVSGSTNNIGFGRGRGRHMILQDQDACSDKDKSNTKFILLAELEGLAHYLNQITKTFDVSNVDLIIWSFSSSHKKCYEIKLKDNHHLNSLILGFPEIINYEQSGTNLLDALKTSLSEIDNDVYFHLIIVTDGQPEQKNLVIDYLKTSDKQFDVTTIGAGSIKDSIGGQHRYHFSRKQGDDVINVNSDISSEIMSFQQMQISKFGGSSECDMSFLINLMLTSKHNGCYCPSFGNYESLIKSANEFFESLDFDKMVLPNFRTILDDGLSDPLSKTITDKMMINKQILVGIFLLMIIKNNFK